MVEISRATAVEPAVQSFLQSNNSDRVARRGELIEVLHHLVILAKEDADIVGVLTYNISGGSCEVLTRHCARRWSGIGTLLLEAMLVTARGAGCKRVSVVTTNDNVDALRFYQRRGFRLIALRPGAVDKARQEMKSTIPVTGSYGLPLRDELELLRTF